MFDPARSPRCFALPLGCDFSVAFLGGLKKRMIGRPPEEMGKVQIFVNTRRTARRLYELFLEGDAGISPRLRVITDLASDPLVCPEIPKLVSPMRRRLELSRTIGALLDQRPDLAPRTALFDLADSLASLMDEMHGEGVSGAAFQNLKIDNDFASHWQKSLDFLDILAPILDDDTTPDREARQRLVVEHLSRQWAANPPEHPVIVAGSTGSRGATARFMQTVARLPNGAVVLPGFDFDLPDQIFELLANTPGHADHPQSGLVKFARSLNLAKDDIVRWEETHSSHPARNKLVSLALRPAPVTDQWLVEGPELGNLMDATQNMGILTAPSPRQEALSIALCLRRAAEDGRKAALISPDRQLTRAVTAALSRWNIRPDDSAGQPLPLSPPGILLRLTAEALVGPVSSEALLVLLKHPLCHIQGNSRAQHLLRTRELEIAVLRGGPPEPDFGKIEAWARTRKNDEGVMAWVDWLRRCFATSGRSLGTDLSGHLRLHRMLADEIVAGSASDAPSSRLWEKPAGVEAARIFAELEENANAAGPVSIEEYNSLFLSFLNTEVVREASTVHPDITIWGTLEARVQGAELVILGGLNDGVWPKIPDPDPWLNRAMRSQIGLLLPERQIGLSAHDFQQAIAAPEVLLSRSAKDSDSPMVASRWLIRLTNLLSGLGSEGKAALAQMEARGQNWRELAEVLEAPDFQVQSARRPSPKPPVSARPKRLSVTQIKTLIRDPYSIYARNVLKLGKLKPIRQEPDALLRGVVLHKALELYVKNTLSDPDTATAEHLLDLTEKIFQEQVTWPATRRFWLARLERIADKFVANENRKNLTAKPEAFEVSGEIHLSEPEFTLVGTADRIDRDQDGSLIIDDYKTGQIPSQAQIDKFDKQLPLEGAMANRGAFRGIDPAHVSGLLYIGLGSTFREVSLNIEDGQIDQAWEGLRKLIRAYQRPEQGYSARARMEKQKDKSDYDHLSRFGEWLESDEKVIGKSGGGE